RWAGIDPATKKPWAQSWVPKSDCTDDLVHEWKRRKSKKRRKGSKGSRLSNASLLSDIPRISKNSVVERRSAQNQNAPTPINSIRNNGKRARSTALSDEEHNEHDPDSTHTKKKQKITADTSKVIKPRINTRRKGTFVREFNNKTVNEPEAMTNSRDKAKNKVNPMTLEEEESSSGGEGPARIQPASSTSRSPSTVRRNVKPRRSPNTRTSSVTSDPDTAYVKFKSGKLSTPKKKRRHKDFVSSSSDEVEVVQAHTSPPHLPTKQNDSLSTISSPTHPQLQADHSPSLSDHHHDEDQMVQEMYNEYVDFDAEHPQPMNSNRVLTTPNGAKDDSYRQGEVPETETESSHNTQSQSQSQSAVPLPKRQPIRRQSQSASSHEDEHPKSSPPVKQLEPLKIARAPTLIIPPHTPPRSSIISRMRPRTPGSSFLLDNSTAFDRSELEMHVEADEEQDEAEATTEQQKPVSTATARKTSKAGSGPLRPIPRLSPSVFRPHLPSEQSASLHYSGTDHVPAEAADEAEVAELVSSIEQFTSPEKTQGKRKIGQGKVDRKGKGKQPANGHGYAEGSLTDDDDSARYELENVVRQRGEQLAAHARAKRQRELDGTLGTGRKKTLIELLSENEERKGKQRARQHNGEHEGRRVVHELEQSLQKKSRSSRASSEDAEHESVAEDDFMYLREEQESTQDLMMDIPNVSMEGVEQTQGQDVEPSGQVTEEIEPPGPPPNLVISNQENDPRTRSKSKSSSHSVRSGHHNPSQDELILPPTAPVPISTPIESQEQDTGPDLVATLALLNEKSQENAQLMKELSDLRAAASVRRPRELELERELEEVRASLVASEKRAADLARGKESAEKDREFFREHYAKASGFVTSVQEENAELQKEAQIAREQASTGVEAVKATYMARVHALEDDARTYKRLAMFIMEKDTRTNDDIRRKAAEEPELRARCDELGKELRGVRNEMVNFQEEVENKEMRIGELEQQLRSWKRQATVLNADLRQLKRAQEGMDTVYQCGWRGDDVPCNQIFPTYEVGRMNSMHCHPRLAERTFLDVSLCAAPLIGEVHISNTIPYTHPE
ncbi:hypothetical protein C0992_007920, partial [Termitomyces sp. T32_za158]